jgi:hypothetical protein
MKIYEIIYFQPILNLSNNKSIVGTNIKNKGKLKIKK